MEDQKQINALLNNLGIKELNALQRACIKSLNKNEELVVLSPTGSGKTLGFLLPLLQLIDPNKKGIQAIILTPSRELALQIENVWKNMSTGLKVNCFYGGHPFREEVKSLTTLPTVLIGTPGRVTDHLRRETFSTRSIDMVVLDEFDKILELGFGAEMEFILDNLPNLKKRVLTSATNIKTIPPYVRMENPKTIDCLDQKEEINLTLKKIVADGNDKLETLFELICFLSNSSTLVFCNHRDAVERISQLLLEKGLAHGKFHGGLEQEERERSLSKFRNGSTPTLLTTDLASRGLDIPEIKNIVHYQLPNKEDAFIHRNGRTARMHASGTAYLVLAESEIIPDFIKEVPEKFELPEANELPNNPEWVTLYVGAGKKEKINKVDLVGLFLQKGGLQKEDLGLIEVKDHACFIAVKFNKADTALTKLKTEKVKNKKVRISYCK